MIIFDDWSDSNTRNDNFEQSPVDISTKNASYQYLPLLRYFGYNAFRNAYMDIINNGHTGMRR